MADRSCGDVVKEASAEMRLRSFTLTSDSRRHYRFSASFDSSFLFPLSLLAVLSYLVLGARCQDRLQRRPAVWEESEKRWLGVRNVFHPASPHLCSPQSIVRTAFPDRVGAGLTGLKLQLLDSLASTSRRVRTLGRTCQGHAPRRNPIPKRRDREGGEERACTFF